MSHLVGVHGVRNGCGPHVSSRPKPQPACNSQKPMVSGRDCPSNPPKRSRRGKGSRGFEPEAHGRRRFRLACLSTPDKPIQFVGYLGPGHPEVLKLPLAQGGELAALARALPPDPDHLRQRPPDRHDPCQSGRTPQAGQPEGAQAASPRPVLPFADTDPAPSPSGSSRSIRGSP